MPLQLPVRQYFQTSDQVEVPVQRVGAVQWVLARSLYRFQTFDLSQVPPKNRSQALQLELTQWTPFSNSNYYIAWNGTRAWVWCWDAAKAHTAIVAQGLKPRRVQILPESLLHPPLPDGLHLCRCLQGVEGQYWHQKQLERSRWWPQAPAADEWLTFQRDAAVSAAQQQMQVPTPQDLIWASQPWLRQSRADASLMSQVERPLMALAALCLLTPAIWMGLRLFQTQQNIEILQSQQTQLQSKAEPIQLARSSALDKLARINALRALASRPSQLGLMQRVAEVLPPNGPTLKDWAFSGTQLKLTLEHRADIAATPIIGLLQQAGPFSDVKALPGRDAKSVMFQMTVLAN